MKTRLIRIGNSRGVRIPKALLKQSGLDDEVRLRVVEGAIIIEAEPTARAGWADAAARARAEGDDGLLDEHTPTRFDDSEWEWE